MKKNQYCEDTMSDVSSILHIAILSNLYRKWLAKEAVEGMRDFRIVGSHETIEYGDIYLKKIVILM